MSLYAAYIHNTMWRELCAAMGGTKVRFTFTDTTLNKTKHLTKKAYFKKEIK